MTVMELPDVQRTAPGHPIAINRVGVRGLRYPAVALIGGESQPVVGTYSLSVALAASERGTHMSRFVEELAESERRLSPSELMSSAGALAERLDAAESTIDVSFPFFLEREAPSSGARALVDYEGRIRVVGRGQGAAVVLVSVRVPVTSLCPCSKEISDYGAHSQRGYVTIEIASRTRGPIGASVPGLDELVDIAEGAASAQIYSLLKRDDERHVTMGAYDRPAFVEDVVRSVVASLEAHTSVDAFRVDVDNQESIHNHSAWAMIEGGDQSLFA